MQDSWTSLVAQLVKNPNFLRSHGLQPIRLLSPWDFPGKSTGVGCHCLLRQPSLRPHKSPHISGMSHRSTHPLLLHTHTPRAPSQSSNTLSLAVCACKHYQVREVEQDGGGGWLCRGAGCWGTSVTLGENSLMYATDVSL